MAKDTAILRTFTGNINSEVLASFLDDMDKVVLKALQEWFEAKGHSMSGKLIADIETEVTMNRGDIIIDYLAYKYGAYLNSGVKPENVPFNPGSGAGKSLFIDGLIRYVQQRMAIGDLKEAKSIAFAIAHTQKQKGMPFKTQGEGSHWADSAAKEAEPELESLFDGLAEDFITKNLTQISHEFNR